MKEERASKLKLIPLELADMMIKAYDKERRLPASEKLTKSLGRKVEDTQSVWISKEALLELFELNKADGVRLYFGLADDYPGHKLKNAEYRKKHTVIMVATQSKDPKNPTMENSVDCLNIPKGSAIRKGKDDATGPLLMPMANSRAGMAADDIPMCPPPYTNDGCLLPLDAI